MIKLVEKNSIKLIYISLNGLSKLSDIKKSIFLNKINEKNNIDLSFIDQITEFGKSIPKIDGFFKIADKTKEFLIDKKKITIRYRKIFSLSL